MAIRRPVFWLFVLGVIALDLWWSGTPASFQLWWIPLFVVNAVCLGMVLLPLIRGRA